MDVLAVALVTTALSFGVGGGSLVRRRVYLTGGLLMAASWGLLVVALRDGPVAHGGRAVLLLCVAAVITLALLCYPRLALRDPVDLVSFGVLGAALISLLLRAGAADVPTERAVREVTVTVAVTAFGLHTWWRLERASPEQRWPLLWMALPAGTTVLGFGVVDFVVPNEAGGTALCLLAALIPPALYLGVTRPRLSDVRGLVARTVVVAAGLATYVAALETAASGLEVLLGRPLSQGGLVCLAAVCALLVAPVNRLLRAVVDELLFGRRPDPLRAASQVVEGLGDDPAAALATIRAALVLPYAAARLVPSSGAAPVVLAASGEPGPSLRGVQMAWPGDGTAELVVGLRAGDLHLTDTDEQVLRLVAPLLAQTLQARAVAAELKSSREATVRALEDERRRLRRDLHDGLGPRLSGIAFTADAARNTIRSDPAAAEALLVTARAEADTAMGEIRQLVYGMRPPALDELGLVPALRQHAATLRTADDQPLVVSVTATDVPRVPAAWESATYRIVAGALDNAARHSGSTRADVLLAISDGDLLVEVRDPGRVETARPGPRWQPGVGITSMRERTSELGGTLTAGPDGRGWVVRCVLPLPADVT